MNELETQMYQDFEPIFQDMAKEMAKHHPENGDSWKTCEPDWLAYLARKSMREFIADEALENPSHVVDILNFCAMFWSRLNGELGSQESQQLRMEKQ